MITMIDRVRERLDLLVNQNWLKRFKLIGWGFRSGWACFPVNGKLADSRFIHSDNEEFNFPQPFDILLIGTDFIHDPIDIVECDRFPFVETDENIAIFYHSRSRIAALFDFGHFQATAVFCFSKAESLVFW